MHDLAKDVAMMLMAFVAGWVWAYAWCSRRAADKPDRPRARCPDAWHSGLIVVIRDGLVFRALRCPTCGSGTT